MSLNICAEVVSAGTELGWFGWAPGEHGTWVRLLVVGWEVCMTVRGAHDQTWTSLILCPQTIISSLQSGIGVP